MTIDPREFAQLLGAEIVGEVPDVGGGPFGMARLAHIMHERTDPRPRRAARPADRPELGHTLQGANDRRYAPTTDGAG